MSPGDQRKVGTALIDGFLRRYVGPEPALDPLVTGDAAFQVRPVVDGHRIWPRGAV